MRRALLSTVAALAFVLCVAVAAPAAGERERWQDDAGASQGVEFTRDITHTVVPTFFDQRAATFSCSDGSSFDDPLVVLAAGDGSFQDLDLKIGSDGSFSYDGPANWHGGSGAMSIRGRFSGSAASGTVQWTATRPMSDGSGTCSGSAGPAQWSAHCSEQCGGSSGGAITIAPNGRPVIGQWALVDVTVTSDGAGRIVAFAHHGVRSCGSFADEDRAAARKGTFGAIERLGEAQIPSRGTYVFHGKYIPDQFGGSDRICAYLTQAPAGDTVLAQGEGSLKIGFALPLSGVWSGSERGGIQGFYTPHSESPKGTARGFQIVGTWGCDGSHSTTHLTGRRWWIGARTESQAFRATPLKARADGSFAFSGSVHPDFSDNYDTPRPKKWPSHAMRVTLSGRFRGGHQVLEGTGTVRGVSGKLLVVNGGRRCSTRFNVKGAGPTSQLSDTIDARYSGTVTR